MNIIAGMHRSGTSLLARLVNEAGGDFGDPAGFYPANRWNSDGYFEQREIIETNIILINHHYGQLAYILLPSQKTIKKRARTHRETLIKLCDKYKNTIVKENRFCLTLGAWREYGCQFDKAVVCIREPLATVKSIKRRNKVPLFWGFKLWQRHITDLLEAVEDLPNWVFSFDAFIDPATRDREILSLLRFLKLEINNDMLKKLTNSAIREDKKVVNLDYSYPQGVRDIWNRLNIMRKQQFGVSSAN